jgi:ketosteroid isomerase-like protein
MKQTQCRIATGAAAFLVLVCAVHAESAVPVFSDQQKQSEANSVSDLQKQFAAAYNRGDVDATAAAFTENAIRVTPSGIFQGRDAIRRGFQDALKLGLHDYSVRRVISRSEGSFVFNVGEWQAKVGDQPFRGYYTAILVRDGGQTKIVEETVTIAAPR